MNRAMPFALCLGLLVAETAAQTRPRTSKPASVSAYRLVAIKVEGTSRYTDKEILAASGLQLGQSGADGDFNEAVKRLGDSGLFSNVEYSYSASAAGTKLELRLVDVEASKLVPASFDNFVWFSDADLNAAVRKSVPLFKGLLPVDGNLLDHVSEALQALLTEKQLPGRVSFMRENDGPNAALNAINYRVEEVTVRIHSVEFPGASPEQAVWLAAAARRLSGAEYSRVALAAAVKFDLLPVYLQRGYLKAAFGQSDAHVLPSTKADSADDASSPLKPTAAPEIVVDAIESVTPGKVYLTSNIDLSGNASIGTKQLAALIHLPVGQPADAVELLRDLDGLNKLYRSRGYMACQIKFDAQLDDNMGTAHYSLAVAEGAQYKMGEVEILGLDTPTESRLQNAWKLHAGEPYNADYPAKFIEDTRQLVPPGVQWKVSVQETPDASDKTVEVEIRFKQS